MDTANRIFALVTQKGIEQKEFAKMVGVSDKTASAWACGRSKSYTKSLSKIAEVLDTTTDYLLTGKTEKPVAPNTRSELITAIMEEYQTATPDEQAQAYAYLLGLKAARRASSAPQSSDQ